MEKYSNLFILYSSFITTNKIFDGQDAFSDLRQVLCYNLQDTIINIIKRIIKTINFFQSIQS